MLSVNVFEGQTRGQTLVDKDCEYHCRSSLAQVEPDRRKTYIYLAGQSDATLRQTLGRTVVAKGTKRIAGPKTLAICGHSNHSPGKVIIHHSQHGLRVCTFYFLIQTYIKSNLILIWSSRFLREVIHS